MPTIALLEKLLALDQESEQRRSAISALQESARVLAAAGDHAGARRIQERLVAESPQDAAAWHALAGHCLHQGAFNDGFRAILRALALEPWPARHHELFGRIRSASDEHGFDDEYARVTGLCERWPEVWARGASLPAAASELRPQSVAGDVKGLLSLGNLLLAVGDQHAATVTYQRATLQGRDPLPWANLADALAVVGRTAEAARARGYSLYFAHQYSGASQQWRPLLSHELAGPQFYVDLADCYFRSGQFAEGAQICREGLARHGAVEQLHFEAAYHTYRQNHPAEAIRMAVAGLEQFPGSAPLQFLARLALPIAYRDEEEVAQCRRRFAEGLEQLERELPLHTAGQRKTARDALRNWTNFYLAYQGEEDRELQACYGRLVEHIMQASYPEWAQPRRAPASGDGRIRVGYLSAYFRLHSVASISAGWLRGRDREQFEVFTYYTGWMRDPVAAKFETLSDHYRHYPNAQAGDAEFEQLCRRILADDLHILVYPDLGMWPPATMLAALRLAPVQCTSWGHPVTSGLPAVDYYLSGDLMEPAGAERQYSESLVRLPNLGVAYENPGVRSAPVRRAEYGIAEDAVVYLSCQSVYKYLPRHDHVYAEIARQVPNARFVFVSLGIAAADEAFQQRVKSTFAEAGLDSARFCIFLPRLAYLNFLALLPMCDVFLDTMDWSGANTAYEAVACGLPIVTLPGKFMRGRHCYAVLQMLGMQELIAADKPEYLRKASRLGLDQTWREQARAQVQSNKERVFDDWSSVKALEDFYLKVSARRSSSEE